MGQNSNSQPKPTDPELQNEGEGSRTATRRYNEGAERAAKHPDQVRKLADEAQKSLEGGQGDELRQAEERGKRQQHD